MNDTIERHDGEARDGLLVQSGDHSQCGQSLGDITERSGVKRRQPEMTGGQGYEEVHDFGTPNLSEHDPVRTHSQGLAHEGTHRDLARTFGVRRASAEKNRVRVARRNLGNVLQNNDSFSGWHVLQQKLDQGRLPAPRRTRDEHRLIDEFTPIPIIVNRVVLIGDGMESRKTERQDGSFSRDRRQHDMNSDLTSESRVTDGTCVVDPTARSLD
jgi:hypothetical protein